MILKSFALFLLPAVSMPWGGSGGFVTSGNGTAVCNCSGREVKLAVGHSSSVTVSVGTPGVSVTTSTGQTGSATAEAAPGECIYFQYNFCCEPGFLWGWNCSLTSAGVKTRKTVADDCR
jgi:hypothetical protein